MTHEITGRYATVQNTRAYYDVCGTGIPLICIHMGWACSLQWHHFMPLMAEAGFKVIAPDLPGHAKSLPVNWQPFRKMHDYAEWVWDFINEVCDGEKPVVCGSGIGGDMTLDIACNHPGGIVAGMPFESAAETGSISFLSGYTEPHTFPGFAALVDNASTSAMHYPCDEEIVIESKWQHRCTYQETCVADMDAWNDHDVRHLLDRIECPIFMYKGEADYHIPEQAVLDTIEAIPNGLAEGGIAAGVGHLIMMEQPKMLAEACLKFLRGRQII
ncbi:MAG: alpha/beta fold hydrolase [Gammaproteobacteria bacterium]|tara:strand:+ start:336 stop:1151 length:816 start_codon:yes stop_codon:yes gene_type:complete